MIFSNISSAISCASLDDIEVIVTLGYDNLFDGGGGVYKEVDDTGTLWPWQFRSHGDTRRWSLEEERPKPEQFGAKGDGVTDDHDAIINANAYANIGKKWLGFSGKTYLTSPIVLGGGMPWSELSSLWTALSFDGRGHPYQAPCLKLKAASNAALVTHDPGGPQPVFRGLIFDGNKAEQTGGYSGAVRLTEATLSAPGDYAYGAHFEFCNFRNGKDFGLYIGRNRGWGSIFQCAAPNNGSGPYSVAWFLDSYDWNVDKFHVGPTIGYGVKLDHVSQLQANALNVFMSTELGVYVTANCTDFNIAAFSLDRNFKVAIQTEANGNPNYKGQRSFVGGRFLGNSAGAHNTHSDVLVGAGDTALAFANTAWMGGEGPVKPKHYIQFGGAGKVRVANAQSDTSRPGYGTSVSNAPANIVGDMGGV